MMTPWTATSFWLVDDVTAEQELVDAVDIQYWASMGTTRDDIHVRMHVYIFFWYVANELHTGLPLTHDEEYVRHKWAELKKAGYRT